MTETIRSPTTERVVRLTRLYFERVGATVQHAGEELLVEFDGVTPPEWAERYCDGQRLVATIADPSGESRSGGQPPAGSETATGAETATEAETATGSETATEAETATGSETPTIGPETPFTRRLIDAAGEHCPVGAASVTGVPEGAETLVPAWLRASPARVASVEFHPYYDEQLVCVWLRVAVETPSQYQRESLHTVVVDCDTGTRVECDPTALLDAAVTGGTDAAATSADTAATGANAGRTAPGASESEIEQAVAEARSHVVAELDDTVERVEASAGRAAAAAFEEYAERQRTRLAERRAERDEIETELATVRDRLADATGDDRVELLERQTALTDRQAELNTAVSRLEAADAAGFPEERERLRSRHSVAVRTRPVAVTTVSVERGDLAVDLVGEGGRATLDLSVGAVTGLRRTPSCPDCGNEYGPQNELRVANGGLACATCRDG